MVGGGDIDGMSCPKPSSHKEQRDNFIRGMGEEKVKTLLSTNMGCLAKVNVPIPKKRKLGPKTVDCVFLGYAFHSIGYRFLVVKSEVPDMHAGTIMESNDATFFEDIFPMKDMATSSNQEMPSSSN